MIKQIFFLALLLLCSLIGLCSCSNEVYISEQKYHVHIYGADFTKYTALGFQITPESYLGNYESIALLTFDYFPAVRQLTFKDSLHYYRPGTQEEFINGQTWFIENISIAAAIDSFYNMAKALGANAIVKFKMDPIRREDGPLDISGFQISGFAIRKIKNNAQVTAN